MAARAAATARPCSAPLAMACCAASRILAQRRAIAPAGSIADSMIARSPVGVSFALPHSGARSPVQATLRAVHLLPPAPKGPAAPAPHPQRPEGWPTRRWPARHRRRTPQCSAKRQNSLAPAPRGARPVTRRARASRQPALARGAVVDGACAHHQRRARLGARRPPRNRAQPRPDQARAPARRGSAPRFPPQPSGQGAAPPTSRLAAKTAGKIAAPTAGPDNLMRARPSPARTSRFAAVCALKVSHRLNMLAFTPRIGPRIGPQIRRSHGSGGPSRPSATRLLERKTPGPC